MATSTRIVPMKVGDAVITVKVQADPSEVEATEERVTGGRIPDFSEVAHGIDELCRSLASVFSKVSPSKASIEFNVGITLKTGKLTALFLEGETEGSIKITMDWESDRKPKSSTQPALT
jgi:Trypsin-co-occurring domain 1